MGTAEDEAPLCGPLLASRASPMLVCADSGADKAFLPLAFVRSASTTWEFPGLGLGWRGRRAS